MSEVMNSPTVNIRMDVTRWEAQMQTQHLEWQDFWSLLSLVKSPRLSQKPKMIQCKSEPHEYLKKGKIRRLLFSKSNTSLGKLFSFPVLSFSSVKINDALPRHKNIKIAQDDSVP